jgi:hypothetical protein
MSLAVWKFDDLVKAAGSLNRGVVIKALTTWVDLGVLKEDPDNTSVPLEREAGRANACLLEGKSRFQTILYFIHSYVLL